MYEAGDDESMKNIAAAVDFGTSKIVTLLAESVGARLREQGFC